MGGYKNNAYVLPDYPEKGDLGVSSPRKPYCRSPAPEEGPPEDDPGPDNEGSCSKGGGTREDPGRDGKPSDEEERSRPEPDRGRVMPPSNRHEGERPQAACEEGSRLGAEGEGWSVSDAGGADRRPDADSD